MHKDGEGVTCKKRMGGVRPKIGGSELVLRRFLLVVSGGPTV